MSSRRLISAWALGGNPRRIRNGRSRERERERERLGLRQRGRAKVLLSSQSTVLSRFPYSKERAGKAKSFPGFSRIRERVFGRRERLSFAKTRARKLENKKNKACRKKRGGRAVRTTKNERNKLSVFFLKKGNTEKKSRVLSRAATSERRERRGALWAAISRSSFLICSCSSFSLPARRKIICRIEKSVFVQHVWPPKRESPSFQKYVRIGSLEELEERVPCALCVSPKL